MAILAYGLNFRTAPIDLRERIAFPLESLVQAHRDLRQSVPAVGEVAILSTCNRTELYCSADLNDHELLVDWLSRYRNVARADIREAAYAHWDRDAARHLMRVAAGLDSQVLGEPQILGQVKDACDTAREAGTLGPELSLLSQFTLNVAKQVRTDTDIGRNPVSVAYAAVTLAQQIFADLSHNSALLLGAGDMIELVAQHLRDAGIRSITIANRTLANARDLAARVGARAIQLTDVPSVLAEHDIVIASTGSPFPVLGKGAVEAAIRTRRHRPMLMVDIAVPRDIEPEVAELRDVYLYSIDDLTQIIESNVSQRRRAADTAEDMIVAGTDRYFREKRIRDAQDLLTSFRGRAEVLQLQELERARQRLSNGDDVDEVLKVFAREASAEGRHEILDYVRALYGLDKPD
jgi:glutamyl-tRNA reductase